DAIVFWQVENAQKAALEITNYRQAIERVSQTSLREMIGASHLAELLSERKVADEKLKEEIGRDPRRRHPAGPAGCDEPPGAGRARAPGARHPRPSRAGGGAEIPRCGR